ncbi:hypothetical protein O4H49_07305 [Kiloniella laminariae]|uniref:Uncharacterized protein n=1 Tax=Kiloniella laminariae TaxID=454162 RepID=A0ABT4LHK5_9PROT|nr:hypothetical protein [Kiloniella laminariae]MCZ4280579.1 hypothetical protein [Kiloniella laminariae]
MLLTVLRGPFSTRRSPFALFSAVMAIILLTFLTQIGGAVLWLAFGMGQILSGRYGTGWKSSSLLCFLLIYSNISFLILPRIAPGFGRVALNCFATTQAPYAANSPLYCLLNRHYVAPELKPLIEDLSAQVARQYPGSITTYLDANFPFFDGFPLLPHKSHQDCRKLDLTLFYQEKSSGEKHLRAGGWFLGYWIFAPARIYETSPACTKDGILRWRMDWLQGLFTDLALDHERTRALLGFLIDDKGSRKQIGKVFLEPYLEKALGFNDARIRPAGCTAARHDDHIHIQLK